jgi:hypothetical protein
MPHRGKDRLRARRLRNSLDAALLIIAITTPCAAGDYPAACRDFTSFPRGDLAQPERPPCLNYLFNRVAIETCRPMMDLYQAQVRSYIECLKGENSSIIETFNAAAQQFNCAQNRNAC